MSPPLTLWSLLWVVLELRDVLWIPEGSFNPTKAPSVQPMPQEPLRESCAEIIAGGLSPWS